MESATKFLKVQEEEEAVIIVRECIEDIVYILEESEVVVMPVKVEKYSSWDGNGRYGWVNYDDYIDDEDCSSDSDFVYDEAPRPLSLKEREQRAISAVGRGEDLSDYSILGWVNPEWCVVPDAAVFDVIRCAACNVDVHVCRHWCVGVTASVWVK